MSGQGGQSQVADLADEITFDSSTLNGSYQSLGTLVNTPVIIIFDNQSDVAIEISKNGSTTWRTFPAGQALVLDLSANGGKAEDYGFVKGKPFWVKGSVAGTGNFSLSYTYRVFTAGI